VKRRRWWGAGALFCWVVALLFVFVPVKIGSVSCDRPVADALSGNPGSDCTFRSARRLAGLAEWLILTAPVTVMFIVQPREPRPPDE
jgi:hypothetical protein